MASSLMPFSFSSALTLSSYLVQFVNRYGNVHYLIGLTDNLGNAAQYLAVVDFNAYTDAEARKYGIDYLHQFHFIQQGIAAHHIGITLIELTITPLLRTVGAPHRLNLVTLERNVISSLCITT